ncbi:hypothetical protein Pyn_24343 [Prunus yedoensis var. nudiflora]|uniref:Uncharacterized protein n=1 Tax=Prunus yedoensis var. nudiflora TaxID=2094558 RepID=A0A314YM30_PRUYE|nr:hypothetical protein Pyn_24343 [Prunus yedoensis var. nudiflora]
MWLGTSRPTGGLNSTSPYGRRIKIRTSETVLRAQTTQLRVYSDTPLRDESSNWGTDTLTQHVRTNPQDPYAWNRPTRADYPVKGLQQHPVKVCPGFRHIHTISPFSRHPTISGSVTNKAHTP